MPFLLIRGTFLPKRGQPDGDSVRFTPDNPALFPRLEQMSHRRLKTATDSAGRVSVQLRYEGIDAMEKDALPTLPKQALDNNLKRIGFREGRVEEPAGYVLASGIEMNGRPIVFVFAGQPSQSDGDMVFLSAAFMRKSVNHAQAKAGLAYPMFYMSLYAELRRELAGAVVAARQAQRGVWQDDKSNTGFPFQTKAAVRTLPPVYPKLYRRLKKTNAQTVDEFLAELAQQRERTATLSDGRFLHFDDVLKSMGNEKLKMTYLPEDLVFQEG